nr:RNA-directed DNA polymerase, eukaryota [Tanacetum cinerariifolium]
ADQSDHKITWVAWDKVLASKKKGGLGVLSFFALNRALLLKWVWRFVSQEGSLWCKVINALYGLKVDFIRPITLRIDVRYYEKFISLKIKVLIFEVLMWILAYARYVRLERMRLIIFFSGVIWRSRFSSKSKSLLEGTFFVAWWNIWRIRNRIIFEEVLSRRSEIMPSKWTPKKRRRFFSQVKNYFWDEPYTFRLSPDNVMRRCIAGSEILKILAHCHSGPTGGHHTVSYVSKWVEAQALPINDARVVIKFLRRIGPKSLTMHYGHSEPPTKHLLDEPPLATTKNFFIELNELMELRDGAYGNTRNYKERTKKWHDYRLRGHKTFKVGDKVLLSNSIFKMHQDTATCLVKVCKVWDDWEVDCYGNANLVWDDWEVDCYGNANLENYVLWSSRLLRYVKSKPNGKLLVNSIKNGPYMMNSQRKKSSKRKVDNQEIQTILIGLPEDIYATVNSFDTTQEIWFRVKQMMKGSIIGIQEKKAKLFIEWEIFTSTEGESIELYYHHFSKLMIDFSKTKHFREKIASNLMFQHNLQLE